MSKRIVISFTLFMLMTLPTLTPYATQMIQPSAPLNISEQPVHSGRPRIPVPPVSTVETTVQTFCPLPAAQCSPAINWGGYAAWSNTFSTAANAGTVTDVKGSWKVPSLTGINSASGNICSDPDTTWYDASIWVGIDGWITQTVEQTGVSVDCWYGQAQYYAWYEFFPAPSITVFMVSPGDKITAEVSYSKTTRKFVATIKDLTSAKSYTTAPTAVSGAAENSAEWIAENAVDCVNPSCSLYVFAALSDFGSVTFSSATATVSGTTGSISSFGTYAQWSEMVNLNFPASPGIKALPTAITKSGSFTLDFESAGP